jgi:Mce-associated membrane protein
LTLTVGDEALEATTATTATADPVDTASPPASWLARAGALVVDVLFGLGVLATAALSALTLPQYSGWWWLCVSVGGLVILATAANRLLLPTITGWTLGRALFGIAVVSRDGSAVGPWRLLARDLAHVLDTAALFVGWLWPLWDPRHRTFADLLLRTEVRSVQRGQRNIRQLTAAVLLVAALLSASAAGLSYLVVYRHDRAIEATRAQISAQGPKIVSEMLSYNADSLQADFTHAQSLTTDTYRPQLVAQQDAVRKGGPVTNEFWVVSGAVLNASPDRASMLLLMQGQRTAGKQQPRFISATVRVHFEKSAGGQWQVADLTVLAKPQPNQAGK